MANGTFTIANTGTATANASTAVIRINQSATSSAGTNLATVNVAALAAGASVNVAPSVTAPATAGSYRVWVLADNQEAVEFMKKLKVPMFENALSDVKALSKPYTYESVLDNKDGATRFEPFFNEFIKKFEI